jgi:hypothetical protein
MLDRHEIVLIGKERERRFWRKGRGEREAGRQGGLEATTQGMKTWRQRVSILAPAGARRPRTTDGGGAAAWRRR